MNNLLFLDTETTGITPDKDRIISIAYKQGDKLVHELFKPPVAIAIEAMSIHYITEKMVADKPPFSGSKIEAELKGLLKDYVLVAHNASFDIAMLEAEGVVVPQFICSLKVARFLDDKGVVPRFNLQYLRFYLELEIEGVTPHDAAGDVIVLEAVFEKFLQSYQEKFGVGEDEAIKEMQEISLRPALIHRINFGKHAGKLMSAVAQSEPDYLRWLLGKMQEDAANRTGRFEDEDMIYSIKHYLQPAKKR